MLLQARVRRCQQHVLQLSATYSSPTKTEKQWNLLSSIISSHFWLASHPPRSAAAGLCGFKPPLGPAKAKMRRGGVACNDARWQRWRCFPCLRCLLYFGTIFHHIPIEPQSTLEVCRSSNDPPFFTKSFMVQLSLFNTSCRPSCEGDALELLQDLGSSCYVWTYENVWMMFQAFKHPSLQSAILGCHTLRRQRSQWLEQAPDWMYPCSICITWKPFMSSWHPSCGLPSNLEKAYSHRQWHSPHRFHTSSAW